MWSASRDLQDDEVVVVTRKGIQVTARDIASLDDGQWVSDNIVDAALEAMLRECIAASTTVRHVGAEGAHAMPLVVASSFSTALVKRAREERALSMVTTPAAAAGALAAPAAIAARLRGVAAGGYAGAAHLLSLAHVRGNHWVELEGRASTRVLRVYDPLQGRATYPELTELWLAVLQLLHPGDAFRAEYTTGPTQVDGSSCALLSLHAVQCTLRGAAREFGASAAGNHERRQRLLAATAHPRNSS
jgi:hypothetical protein